MYFIFILHSDQFKAKYYLNLIKKCIFFEGEQFPLSPVATCLYMELLECEMYQQLMGEDVIWLGYADDILVVVPETMNLYDKLNDLNSAASNLHSVHH